MVFSFLYFKNVLKSVAICINLRCSCWVSFIIQRLELQERISIKPGGWWCTCSAYFLFTRCESIEVSFLSLWGAEEGERAGLPASRISFQHIISGVAALTLLFALCRDDMHVSAESARDAANQGVCVLYISTHMHTLRIHKPLCNYAANGMKWNLFTNSGGGSSGGSSGGRASLQTHSLWRNRE